MLAAACALGASAALWRHVGPTCWAAPAAGGRRGFFAAAAGAVLAAGSSSEAQAFENAVKKVKRDLNNPKRPGQQPVDLGLKARPPISYDPVIKNCPDREPNCFSTTVDVIDGELHDYKPWVFKGKTTEAAYQDLVDNINAYEPGQQGIDGGGFKIVAQDGTCIYVQFESLKRGHLDDVEFCLEAGLTPNSKEGSIQVRSSSRQGFFDYGVNAVRLNALAKGIETKGGWSTSQITYDTHPRYWQPNCIGGDGAKAAFNVRERFPDFCKLVPIQKESSLQGRL